jgi:5-(carboxyamino)imidazole ribonucleotide mutase
MAFRVPIISGSKSDKPHVSAIEVALESFGIDSTWDVASAHKQHEKVIELVDGYYNKGSLPVVTVAGRSDALSGCVAARSRNPVVASRPDHDKPYDLEMYYFSTVGTPSLVAPGAVLGPEQTAGYVNRMVRMMLQPPDRMIVAINSMRDDSCVEFSNEVVKISRGKVFVSPVSLSEYEKYPVGVIIGSGNADDYSLIDGAADSGRPVIYSPGIRDKQQLLELGRQFFHSDYRPEVAVVMDPKNAALFAASVIGLYDPGVRQAVAAYKSK